MPSLGLLKPKLPLKLGVINAFGELAFPALFGSRACYFKGLRRALVRMGLDVVAEKLTMCLHLCSTGSMEVLLGWDKT